jgi:hypothetical protein
VHFLDAWTELTLAESVALGGPALLALLALALNDLRWAGWAVGLAPLPVLVRPGVWSDPYAWLWALAGVGIGVRVAQSPREAPGRPRARAGVEMALLATLLVGASGVALLFALAQQPFAPDDVRDATLGIVLVALGLMHLLLRRHLARGALGFFTVGAGLAILGRVANGALPAPHALGAAAVLATTLVAAVVALRSAHTRAEAAGSVWIGAAHDLHD